MPVDSSAPYSTRVKQALADSNLRTALDRATSRLRTHRAQAIAAIDYARLRDDFQANYTLDFVIDNADFGDYAALASAFKSELALQREREERNTIGVDSLSMEDFEMESIEELEE